jgi:hypothetical protein
VCEARAAGTSGLAGKLLPNQLSMDSYAKPVKGSRVRGFLDFAFVALSFLVFLALEGALVYAFFVFINQ